MLSGRQRSVLNCPAKPVKSSDSADYHFVDCRCYPSERNSQRQAWKELRIEKICVCPCGVLFLNNPQKPTNTCRQKAAREWTMPHQSARGCKNGWRIGNHWNKHVQSNLFKTFMQICRNTCEALASKRLLRYECFQSSSNSSVDLQGSPNSWHFRGLSLSDVRIFLRMITVSPSLLKMRRVD